MNKIVLSAFLAGLTAAKRFSDLQEAYTTVYVYHNYGYDYDRYRDRF